MVDEKTQALAKRQPMMSLQAVTSAFPEGRFNLLLPKVHIGELPAGTQLAIREVRIRDNPIDVYSVDGGKVALTKTALNRIASAAGITWVAVYRTDDRCHPHYCEFTVRARVSDFDGTIREAVGTKTIDLRDDAGDGTPGKDRASIRSDKQLAGARKFVAEMCASKAMNRAISDVLAIPRSYTPEDLAKPFVVPKLVPDSRDPMAQRAILAGMVGATQALFGAPSQAPIVDAIYEPATTEADIPPPSGGSEAAESPPLPDSAASELPAMDGPSQDPEAKPDEATLSARLNDAWQKAKAAGMNPGGWREFVATNTGKARYQDLTIDDLYQIDAAVAAYVEGQS
jgi:hypothetical protein